MTLRLSHRMSYGDPAWLQGAVANTWGTLPASNTLSSVDPDPGRTSAWAGASGQAAIITAWGGASFDKTSGNLWINAGGGHGDYLGNESYKLTLDQATPAFSRLNSPSNLGSYSPATGTDYTYSDGKIRSTHHYNGCIYIPNNGPAMAGVSSRSTDGGFGTGRVAIFSESDGSTTFGAEPTNSGNGTPVAACFDPTRGTEGSVWRRRTGTSLLQRWDVAADTWTDHGSAQAWSGMTSLTMSSDGAYILVGNGDDDLGQSVSGGWCVFRVSNNTYYFPTFSGTVSGTLWPGKCQPVWVEALGCFCAWDNTTDRTLITTLTPPADPYTETWTIGALTVSGSNVVTPSAAQVGGTYGRFANWPDKRVFILLNSTSETGYFFKY